MKKTYILLFLLFTFFVANAQNKTASVFGTILDAKNNQPLFPAKVYLSGTMYGAQTDLNGKYKIENVPAGEYTVEMSSVGYERQIFTGVKLMAGDNKQMDASLSSLAITGKEIKIIGEKPLQEYDNGKTQKNIGKDVIEFKTAKAFTFVVDELTKLVFTSMVFPPPTHWLELVLGLTWEQMRWKMLKLQLVELVWNMAMPPQEL